jgi:hypothetical protein
MSRALVLNLGMNLAIAIAFVYFNTLALQAQLEETFVTLSVLFGVIVVVGNVFYIAAFCRK